jgi:benzoylformate decarboxylase
MTEKSTVRSVTYDLLRSLGLTTVFGNPGSTEQTFLQEFPADFSYVLALQEASAIAMADAFAQVTRRPALVNLHSSAGLGNAMGNLVSAYHGNTPLIVTAGQQHRELRRAAAQCWPERARRASRRAAAQAWSTNRSASGSVPG